MLQLLENLFKNLFNLNVSDEIKAELKQITPSTYLGIQF